MTFNDLKFETHPRPEFGGIRARAFFPNGYGVSVVQGPKSIGGRQGLYELAVIDHDERLVYTTPITDDVVGDLTPEDVTDLMAKVEAL